MRPVLFQWNPESKQNCTNNSEDLNKNFRHKGFSGTDGSRKHMNFPVQPAAVAGTGRRFTRRRIAWSRTSTFVATRWPPSRTSLDRMQTTEDGRGSSRSRTTSRSNCSNTCYIRDARPTPLPLASTALQPRSSTAPDHFRSRRHLGLWRHLRWSVRRWRRRHVVGVRDCVVRWRK